MYIFKHLYSCLILFLQFYESMEYIQQTGLSRNVTWCTGAVVYISADYLWLTDWLTEQLTRWRRILLVKLLIPQPVQKFPTYCGTTRFMTVFTAVHHLAVPWFRLIPAAPAYFSKVHFSIALPSAPSLTSDFFPASLLHQKPVPHMCRISCLCCQGFDHLNYIWRESCSVA